MPCDCNRLCECLTLDTGEPETLTVADVQAATQGFVAAYESFRETAQRVARTVQSAYESLIPILGEEDEDPNPFPNGPPPLQCKPVPPLAAQWAPPAYRGMHRGQR